MNNLHSNQFPRWLATLLVAVALIAIALFALILMGSSAKDVGAQTISEPRIVYHTVGGGDCSADRATGDLYHISDRYCITERGSSSPTTIPPSSLIAWRSP
jgi:hypothetical protein